MSRVNAKVNHADNSVGVGEASRASSGWWKSNLEEKNSAAVLCAVSVLVDSFVVAKSVVAGGFVASVLGWAFSGTAPGPGALYKYWTIVFVAWLFFLVPFVHTAPGPGALYKYWTIADLALLSTGFVFRGISTAAAAAAA